MSEIDNSTSAVAGELIPKPVNTDYVSSDEVDRVAVEEEKAALTDDTDRKNKREIAELVDEARTDVTNSNGDNRNGVTGELSDSEISNFQHAVKSDELKNSTDDAKLPGKAVPEVADAAVKPRDKLVEDEKIADPQIASLGKTVSNDADTKNSDVGDNPISSDYDVEKPSSGASKTERATNDKVVETVEKLDSKSMSADERCEGALKTEKVEGIFTDDMVMKIEQNYSPTDSGTVNLLEIPDDEMFGSEAKTVQVNGSAENIRTAVKTNGITTESADKPENSEVAEAANLFLQGKRNMFVKDYESAVNILGDACQKFSSVYGDLGVECAEVYMAYGQALLELWRVEDSNKKSDQVADETKYDDDAAPDESEMKENRIDENDEDTVHSEKEDIPSENVDVSKNDESVQDDSDTENGDETIDETRADDETQAKNNDEEEVESEEDVDNLQVAWEILELAKKIYEKMNDYANLAKVHSKLAEISIASGTLAYAIDDLKRSLELLSTSPSVDVRLKATIHFQFYLVHKAKCSFPEAEAELRIAKSTFESYLRDLERKLAAVDKNKSGEVDAITAEIEEIRNVIQDLNTKIIESHKEKRELISAISDVIKTKHPVSADMPSSSASSSDTPSSSGQGLSKFSPLKANVPINNISHLVRKKPKNVTEEPEAVEKKEIEKSTNEPSSVAENPKSQENGTAVATDEAETAINSNHESSKRKAEDDLENDAKKLRA